VPTGKACFVILDGGILPQSFIGESRVVRFASVQTMVRADRHDYDGGLDDARELHDTIKYAALTDYIDVRVDESEPLYLGEDEDGQSEWSIRATLWFES
jgi:hypothetical protein